MHCGVWYLLQLRRQKGSQSRSPTVCESVLLDDSSCLFIVFCDFLVLLNKGFCDGSH